MSTELPPEPSTGPRVVLPDEPAPEAVDPYQTPLSIQPESSLGKSLLWSAGLASIGAALWAAVTLITDYQLGLIAIAVGYLAGIGAAKGGHGTRSQIVGVLMAAFGYFLGQLIIVATLLSEQVESPGLGFVFEAMFIAIASSVSDVMGLLFLGIALWEGWRIPRAENGV